SAKLANDITPAATPRTWAAATRVKLGLTSDQVQAVLGAPQMIVNMGPKVIYYYNGLEVTFKDGKVSDAQEMQSHMHGTIDKVLRRLQEEQGAESKR
ncbi:MAG: hypothetical protein ABSG51_12435, partial [Terracidiphilus sp.]